MFIDYLTLLLMNMAAGFTLLAAFLVWGLGTALQKGWVPAFAAVGLVAVVFGGHTTMTWPLPGAYNMAYGEMSVLFGILFLGAALALAYGWSLLPIAGYGLFAGLAAITVGVGIISREMTQQPLLSGGGFILSGLAGVFAAPVLGWFSGNRVVRSLAALALLVAAGIWTLTGVMAYWGHLDSLSQWRPG